MKTCISRQTLRIAAIAACLVMLFATVLFAKAKDKAKSEPNTVSTKQAPAKAVVSEPNKPAKTAADEPNKTAETADNSVAVTVNGVNITEGQVDAQLKPQLAKISTQLPPAFIEQYKNQLRQQVLEGMIVEQLLDEQVKEKNIVVTDANVTEHLEKAAAQQGLTLNDVKEMMEARGQSFDEAKQRIKKGMTYQKLMEGMWAGKINVTEDDAKKYYDENKTKFETPEQVSASHILIMPDPNDPNADQAKAKAKAKAEDLLKKIKDGADFAELAKTNSDDKSSAVQGGDLGYFAKNQMVPSFEKAAFALKPGQVSDVVETQYGFHIIKLTGHKDPNTISYEQAKDDIMKMLAQGKQADFAEEYVKSLKDKAKIVYPPGKEPPPAPAAAGQATMAPARSDNNKPAPEPEKKTSDKKKSSDKKK